MATHIQLYRGTTAQHATYTGPVGEPTYDTSKQVVVMQDGVTAGGIPMAREDRQILAGDSAILLNGGASADLSADITLTIDNSALADSLVDSDDQILSVNSDGEITATITLNYNTTTGKFDLVGSDGTTVISSVTVPSAVSMLQSAEFSTTDGSNNTGAFLHFVFLLDTGATSDLYVDVTTLIDVYTAGDGIDITSNVVSVVVSTDSGNLVQIGTDGGVLVATSDIEDIIDNAVTVVSADTGNIITEGSDEGALLTAETTAAAVVSSDDNMLTLGSDNLLVVPTDFGTM